VLSRRELVRVGVVGGLVVLAPGIAAGCSDDAGQIDDSHMGDGLPRLDLVASDVERVSVDPAAIADGRASVVGLGAGLYGRLVAGAGNVALSPYSVAAALGMTVNGAVGATRDEMLDVMGADDVAALDDGLNALTAYVESLAGPVAHVEGAEITLSSANQLFGQAGAHWEPGFLDALARSFGAGVRGVDYARATEEARTAINRWTAEQTHERIPEIVSPGAIDSTTRLVLVNALYL
jgi:serpin B